MIKWFAEASCDALCSEVGGTCTEKTEVTLVLDKERCIKVEAPEGWEVHRRGWDDSYGDDRPNLEGDDLRVYCPKHQRGECACADAHRPVQREAQRTVRKSR